MPVHEHDFICTDIVCEFNTSVQPISSCGYTHELSSSKISLDVPSLSCFLWQRKIGCSQWMHNPSYEIFQLVAQSLLDPPTAIEHVDKGKDLTQTPTGTHYLHACWNTIRHFGWSGIKALLHSNRKEHSNTKKDHGWMTVLLICRAWSLWQRKIGCSQWMHNPSYEIFQLVAQSSSWSTHSYWTCRQWRERLDTDTNWYGQHFWIKFRLCPIHSAAHVGTPSDTLADVQ